jgi:hypothetical protein
MLVPLYSEWQGQGRTGQGISLFAGNPDTGFFCYLLSLIHGVGHVQESWQEIRYLCWLDRLYKHLGAYPLALGFST